jgi:hypothetical protein
VCPQREPGHDTKAPAPATLDPPEQVRIRTGVGDPHRAIGSHDLGFQQARCSHPICLREASETATLDQTRNANGHASATLDVAPSSRRNGVVDLAPDRARFDRDCLLWLVLSLATSTDKRGVQGNGIHPSCPNQQRVCRIGCTLIAVATTLHDESQIVLAGKIDGRHNIIGCLGGHRIGAWSGRPAPDPAQGLREPNLIAEVIGILQFLQNLRAVGARWHFQARSERRLHLKEPPLDIPSESVPVCFGRPCWITRPDA